MDDAGELQDARVPASHDGAGADAGADDGLEQLRARLEDIDATPMDERAALFEEANAMLVAELAALDEV